jgi:hypothetical protein
MAIPDNITDKEVKRPNYFTTQFLQETDFQDEQEYHIRLRRANNQAIHGWGIIKGLDISRTGDREISVTPGMAIDKLGREIVLAENSLTKSYRLTAEFKANDVVFFTIAYANVNDDADKNPSGDTTKFVRVTERPELSASKNPGDDGTTIVLGQVTLDATGNISSTAAGGIGIINSSSRRIARSQSSPIVGTAKDGDTVPAPDGNPANWVIFVSINNIQGTTFIFGIDVSSETVLNGWKIKCVGITSGDGLTTVPGIAHYMILRNFDR